jgi:uncharacterized protein (TIGR00288 family)
MKLHRVGDGERSLAVFIDFENMGLGFNNRRDRFEINKVLERLVEKGKIVAKKAYADWSRFGMYTGGLHEAAIELIEIPRRGMSGKNSADIRLVVDAIDLAYSKDHIDTFVIVSGDSDFSPLVSKLKELGKHVIGLGLVDATSDLLRDNCDEFIYYEDLDRAPIIPVAMNEQFPERKRKVFGLLLDSLLALRRENKEVIYSSMLKDTIKRKKPSFNEEYYGYRTFSELLEDAQKEGLLEIEKHKPSGMYVVTRFGLEMKTSSASLPLASNGSEPRRIIELPKPAVIIPVEKVEKRELVRPRAPEKPIPIRPLPVRPAVVIHPTPAVPPPTDEPPTDTNRLLGRALVDEFDDLEDEVSEVPSYSPAKPPAKPSPRPAKPASAPKAKGEPAQKSPRKSASKPASKPATPKPNRGTASARGRSEPRKSEPKAAPPPVPQPPVQPVVPPPAPKPFDEDDFGAGLDT